MYGYWNSESVDFKDMVGKVIVEVKGAEKGSDEIVFVCEDGTYKQVHFQDCCESVYVEDVNLIGTLTGEVLNAYEAVNAGPESDYGDSQTWTFYHITTMSGDMFIRWLGSSNGYYGEGVDFIKEINEEES